MGQPKPTRDGDGDGVTFSVPPPPVETDPKILALRAKLAAWGRVAQAEDAEQRLPQKLVPWALAFAVGVWLAVLAAFAPQQTMQLTRWAENTAARWTAPPAVSHASVVESRVVDDETESDGVAENHPGLVPPVPRNCAEARALGLAPALEGQPGYAPWMDGDDDGISCEPVPPWRRAHRRLR